MATKHESGKQYFIAIIPPSPVFEDVQKLKELFRDQYHSKAALNSPPHITLHMPFLWDESKEKKLVSGLEKFVRGRDPIKVCLDNFSSFAPRVIFLGVTASDVLNELQRDLHRFFKREFNVFNANYQDRPYHAHLTLAFRDLRKEQYRLAWRHFSQSEYKAEFMSDRIALLKHNGKTWDVLREFLFASSYSTNSHADLGTTEG